MLFVAAWHLLLATACFAVKPCEDSLDWSAGKHIPFDHATLQRSISHVGNLKRFRNILQKLGGNESARVLVVGGSFTHAGDPSRERVCSNCWGRLWQDVFIGWLRRTFLVDVDVRELHISGALSHHLQTVPRSAKAFLPDLILVETSLIPLIQNVHGTPSDQTGRYLIGESFMRSLLELPNVPAVVWLELMAAPPYISNEMTDSLLTEYYDVPQVSIKTAWKGRMPFDASEIWADNPLKLTALGHKLVAVTLVNFMCFEFKHTCHSEVGVPSKVLPKPLFSPQPEGKEDKGSEVGNFMALRAQHYIQRLSFCNNKDVKSLPSVATQTKDSSPHTAWSAFAMVALIPILLLSICAFFVKAGSQYYLENNLPMQLPELEFLRIIATINIVAFQFYQELPPPWAYGGDKDEDNHGVPCVWCRSGKYCFQFFFLYSGFVLTLSVIRNGTSNAIWQYAQVWPLHAFGLILSLMAGAEINPLSLELCACLVHSWGPPFHSDLNGPSWYLSTLLAFWIILPLWVRAADRVSAVRGIFGISIFLVCVWLSTLLFPIFVYFYPLKLGLHEQDPELALQNMQAFRNFIQYSPYCNWAPTVMGILLACLVMLGIEPRSSLSAGICLVVASVGLGLAWFLVPSSGFEMGTEHLFLEKGFGLLPMFSMLILGSIGARNFSNPFHRLVTGRWMLLPAKLCWPVFILHEPVHKICLKHIYPLLYSSPNASWMNMCLYPVALFLTSLLASALIDQPWARLLYRCRQANKDAEHSKDPQGYAPYENRQVAYENRQVHSNRNMEVSYDRYEKVHQGYRNNRNMTMRE